MLLNISARNGRSPSKMARTISEEQKRKMAEGRKKAAAQRAKAIVPRVQAFKDWVREDAEYDRLLRMHREYNHEHPGPRPKMPPIPKDEDYEAYDKAQLQRNH